jgi:Mg2+ and Co2+ transporter CorA
MKTACTSTPSSSLKMRKTTPATLLWHLLSAKAACSPCERELPAFRLYRMRARSQAMVDGNAYELLLDLFETKIEQLADEIENIYSDLENSAV